MGAGFWPQSKEMDPLVELGQQKVKVYCSKVTLVWVQSIKLYVVSIFK